MPGKWRRGRRRYTFGQPGCGCGSPRTPDLTRKAGSAEGSPIRGVRGWLGQRPRLRGGWDYATAVEGAFLTAQKLQPPLSQPLRCHVKIFDFDMAVPALLGPASLKRLAALRLTAPLIGEPMATQQTPICRGGATGLRPHPSRPAAVPPSPEPQAPPAGEGLGTRLDCLLAKPRFTDESAAGSTPPRLPYLYAHA